LGVFLRRVSLHSSGSSWIRDYTASDSNAVDYELNGCEKAPHFCLKIHFPDD
jgi:hypothetical protein